VAGSPFSRSTAALYFAEVPNCLFGQFCRECFSGGGVLEAPSNVVVHIVASAQHVVPDKQ